MSQENVETMRRGIDAFNRGDLDAWLEMMDPEIEWVALMEVYRGHAGARQFWETLEEDVALTVRMDDFHDLGDNVLALGEMTVKGRTTRLDMTGELAQLATFREGKVVAFRDFGSHAEGLAAAGLSE